MRKLYKDTSWKANAACRGVESPVFYDVDENGEFVHIDSIRSLCSSCPVFEQCVDYSVSNPIEEFGAWGAMNYSDRLRIKRLTRNPYERYGESIDSVANDLYQCL